MHTRPDDAKPEKKLSDGSTLLILPVLGVKKEMLNPSLFFVNLEIEKKDEQTSPPELTPAAYFYIQKELNRILTLPSVTYENIKELKQLMRPGLCLDKIKIEGESPLLYIVSQQWWPRFGGYGDKTDAIAYIFAKYTKNLNEQDSQGRTAFYWSACIANVAIMSNLLRYAEVDPRIKTNTGMTVLDEMNSWINGGYMGRGVQNDLIKAIQLKIKKLDEHDLLNRKRRDESSIFISQDNTPPGGMRLR